MPLWNYAMNQGGPDPDYVYSTAEIDSSGVYRISGFRGTSRFVDITQQAFDMLNPDDMGGGTNLNVTHDLDDLTIDERGYFSVVLSAERPEGHTGDWWELDPAAKRLLMRRCSCDWTNEVDARVAIERLDDGGRRHDAGGDRPPLLGSGGVDRGNDQVRHAAGALLPRAPRREHLHALVEDRRHGRAADAGVLRRHPRDRRRPRRSSSRPSCPRRCRYWQALVADDRFCTVDWVNRQSSLNDAQAHIDSDGKFRAVISQRDPGVPNWLDKADYPWGVIQMRWNRASDYPDPTIKKVPVAEVRDHLPADTPVVTPEQRREQLRARREGAQLRRIW